MTSAVDPAENHASAENHAQSEHHFPSESQGPAESDGPEHNHGIVSLRADVPEALHEAMREFIDHHPHWDQYRLFQAALAGFLVQQGLEDRGVTRWYLAHLFPAQGGFGAKPVRRAA